jgi:hypothetical protein
MKRIDVLFLLIILLLSLLSMNIFIKDVQTLEAPETEWTKTYGETLIDSGGFVVQNSDGSYVIGGSTDSFGVFDRDFWLIKIDANGNLLWNRTYGGIDREIGDSHIETSDGGFAIIGRTYQSGSSGPTDIWLIKTDKNGNQLWNKTYGGISYENGKSVLETNDGGFVIAGTTDSFGG